MYKRLENNLDLLEFTKFCDSINSKNITLTSKGKLKINGNKITTEYPEDLELIEITSIETSLLCKVKFCLGSQYYTISNSKSIATQVETIITKHKYNITEQESSLLSKLYCKYFTELFSIIRSSVCRCKSVGWSENYYLRGRYLDNDNQLIKLQKAKLETNKLDYFINNILSSATLCTIISYSICSISKYYQKDEYPNSYSDNDSFYCSYSHPISLCITGKANKLYKKKELANILCNIFKNPDDKYSIRQVSSFPHFRLRSFNTVFHQIALIGDCPIIITPTANSPSISSTSPIIKRIEKLQQERKLKFFPVYISEHIISRDYTINCNINDIDSSYIEWLVINKDFIDSLYSNLLDFLVKISDKEPTNAEIYKKITYDNLCKVNTLFDDDTYNTELSLCYSDLLTAFYLFCDYLKHELKIDDNRTIELFTRTKSMFCKAATDIEYTSFTADTCIEPDYSKMIYLQFIEFTKLAVHDSNMLKVNIPTKYYNNLDHLIYQYDDCTYLDYNTFISIFPRYLNNHGISNFTKSKISSLFCTCPNPLIERPCRGDGTIRELYWIKKGKKLLKLTNYLLNKIN